MLCRKFDSNPLARISPPPHRHRLVALQHHMVREDCGKSQFRGVETGQPSQQQGGEDWRTYRAFRHLIRLRQLGIRIAVSFEMASVCVVPIAC